MDKTYLSDRLNKIEFDRPQHLGPSIYTLGIPFKSNRKATWEATETATPVLRSPLSFHPYQIYPARKLTTAMIPLHKAWFL